MMLQSIATHYADARKKFIEVEALASAELAEAQQN
jgi:hypothetical protein